MRGAVVVTVVAVAVAVVCRGAYATTASPQTASEVGRTQVKMVTSAPRPEALVLLKDCPVYVLGEFRGVKKHGDTWFNDESACEYCKCVDGQKRCYYHYCNERLTEGFMTPPSGRPPLDDEDREDGMEEGSGHQPIPDDYYKVINHFSPVGDGWGVGAGGGGNEAQATPMCSGQCEKNCPWGYKLDKDRGCLRCKCHKCPSMDQCHERCLGGLARDARGCRVCKCRRKDLSLLPPLPPHPTTPHHKPAHTPPSAINTHTHHGHSKEDCNDTDGGVSSHTEGGGWHDANTLHTGLSHDTESHGQRSSDDGTTKSAVQASPVEWWQVWVIATPLVLVVVVVCGAVMRYWRRYHHDKYRINAYRPTETEKLRPVTTADDHHLHHNHNHHIPHL